MSAVVLIAALPTAEQAGRLLNEQAMAQSSLVAASSQPMVLEVAVDVAVVWGECLRGEREAERGDYRCSWLSRWTSLWPLR